MQTTTYQIHINKKIALVTDLHNRPGEPVLEALTLHHPDLIAIAGDFVYGNPPVPDDEGNIHTKLAESFNVLPFLQQCPGIAPTYLSLGNHEWMLTDGEIEQIRSFGIHVLDNTYLRYDQELLIGGLTSAWVTDYRTWKASYTAECPLDPNPYPQVPTREKYQRYSRIPQAGWLDDFENQPGYKILLSHHPEYWALQEPFLKNRKLHLVLSGHAHGGQFRYYNPFNHTHHGVFSPGEGIFPKYTEGIHEGEYGQMIVSRGLANTTWIPRLFNPTELVLIS